MWKRVLLSGASSLTILGLLVTGCAPAANPAQTDAPGAGAKKSGAPQAAAPTPSPKPSVEQPKYGGVFVFLTDGDPPSFDAHQEPTYWTFHPIGPATSTLLQFDPMENTKVTADLAERWEASPDGLTYTLYLRKGAKFHDGMPATAEDARFSLDRIRKPPKGMNSPRQLNLSRSSR